MAEAAQRLPKGGETFCCVVDCHNSNVNTKGRVPPVRFYRFPGKYFECKRRKNWIAAIRRVNPDGTPWFPTADSRICSMHFIGNRKSNMTDHPAFVPTIFPPVCNNKAPDPEKVQRWQKRTIQAASSTLDSAGDQHLPQTTAEPALTVLPLDTPSGAELTKEQEQQTNGNDSSVGAKLAGTYTCRFLSHPAVHQSSIKKAQKRRTIYSSKACQTRCSTVGKLSFLLSMTNGAEASTQVTHVQQADQVTVTNES
ncbi:uncharacterized protein LOC144104112 isoform X1 [Amblyomma americanum]